MRSHFVLHVALAALQIFFVAGIVHAADVVADDEEEEDADRLAKGHKWLSFNAFAEADYLQWVTNPGYRGGHTLCDWQALHFNLAAHERRRICYNTTSIRFCRRKGI